MISQISKDGFYLIKMESSDKDLSLEINQDRGNIISSIIFNGNEMIHIDRENYLSQERPRCGCPVLFPFCGVNEDNQLNINSKSYPTGIHGVVHTNKWTIQHLTEKGDGCVAEMYTTSDETTKEAFPFDFRLDAKITLQGHKVTYATKITNLSGETMPCDLGFHPFFTVSGLANLQFDMRADTVYYPGSKRREACEGADASEIKAAGMIFEHCQSMKITDTNRKVCIRIENEKEFQNLMLWTGNENKFLVVEPLTAIPNAINDKTNRFNIPSGESVEAVWSFEPEIV
ncbi:aldose epimerase family protein [Caproiciproducens faecalis]|uniref:Aldose 1-epimerase n=1 Tax=Caproiciproducens faecalis TaxID=2820301 RepID=A0ABS7DMY5_9FIRM|nr:hypothetical protein [Caproiciproducens faecalis]MBW7572666.1 hypothetical protein [Caproiciproducens faecalis]